MSCPTCDHTMQKLLEVECEVTGKLSQCFWCPRCGSIKVDGPGEFVHVETPKLVERCRGYYDEAIARKTTQHDQIWHRLGIAEALHRPEGRS